MNRFYFLQRPIVVLLTLPAGIATTIGVLPYLLHFLTFDADLAIMSFLNLDFDVESARAFLTVVAGGAMTALSLTYSLVLVVFTLAAGNIGPRLLKRFTSELVNQVTAGILGGTFLYALGALLVLRVDRLPLIIILGAGALAVISVVQLIYFVRHVSQSVSVDDEIAEISSRLSQKLTATGEAGESHEKVPDSDEFTVDICCRKAGYIGAARRERLLDIVSRADMVLQLSKAPGDFVLFGEVIARATGEMDEETVDAILECLPVRSSRHEDGSMQFSINLLVEIALRALSPGVNDTFTAIAAADGLSDALSRREHHNPGPTVLTDAEGVVRLIIPKQVFKQFFGQSFHPLRRASRNNILMAQALARTFSRIHASGDKAARDVVRNHASLLMQEITGAGHNEADIESVAEFLSADIRP
ncbi:putative membrane protein [Hoeflea marina]|uniref:Putative membrane protein n=1 Tax=Hoeflea marina TaxID=274592 RepID=A0A317PMN5_9HYPH|nr:DUF2254 family protein [Hoeflea marina]PWW02017.1 putative membrane protein [Hoeflea marina]